jgi:uncharacterized protein
MDCPVCQNTKLVMSERQGIEIDYCPDCRGVWLDRGELDKIIERSSGAAASAVVAAPVATPVAQPASSQPASHASQQRQPEGFGHSRPSHGYPGDYEGQYKKKKKESFLSDLFDF